MCVCLAPYVPPAPSEDEDKLFQTISKGINFDKYDSIPVEATGRDVPPHITGFDDSNIHETIKENIRKSNYEKPTPVQKYAISSVLANRDLMGCAQTGSGKTVSQQHFSVLRLVYWRDIYVYRLLYWRDTYIRLLYWQDAALCFIQVLQNLFDSTN